MYNKSRQLVKLKKFILEQQWLTYSTEVNKASPITRQYPITMQYSYGQPTSMTHPHLLKSNELTPGIQMKEYQRRRNALIQRIIQNQPNLENIVVITSAYKQYMSQKIPYIFRQNTEFLYFTGCLETDSAIILHGHKNGDYRSVMFVRPKDNEAEMWDGPRTGVEAAKEMFGVDDCLPVSDFGKYCADHMRDSLKMHLWYDTSSLQHPLFHPEIIKLVSNEQCISPLSIMHEMRLIKTPCEVKLLQKSCDITAEAIKEAIRITKPGMTEHQVFATVDYHCRMNGAEMLAYPPVVATGNNATTIHYINNNQMIMDGDTVLMDAGSEYHGYTADITRTWPANGKFTNAQRVLYEIVLEIEETLIKDLANMPSLDQLFKKMCVLLGQRLCNESIMVKGYDKKQYFDIGFRCCGHHVGHYLGMDVHDTVSITRNQPVRPGMVVTIEPGVYISTQKEFARPEFRGTGIRIEDDILITESGPVILSKNCPKLVHEIEALARLNNV